MKPKDVMTIDELAEYMQVSKPSLDKLAQDGKVPGQKVGKYWRFRREATDRCSTSASGRRRATIATRIAVGTWAAFLAALVVTILLLRNGAP